MTEAERKAAGGLAEFGMGVPSVLLPAKGVDLEKWAALACDQYTGDSAYWEKASDFVGSAPSTLKIIFPEVYLESDDKERRIIDIHNEMNSYLNNKNYNEAVFAAPRRAGVFVERSTRHGVRKGLLLACDLEKYDWKKDSLSLIRATEETIPARLPPRVKIRENAPLETPHIMLLINDTDNILLNVVEKILRRAPDAYNTKLMFDSGRLRGRLLCRGNDWAFIADALQYLHRQSETNFKSSFLFAVGDGNHSLAAAKETWERYKNQHRNESDIENHPARWALAEIVNLHDPSLVFEPIHRLLKNVGIEDAKNALKSLNGFSAKEINSKEELLKLVCDESAGRNRYGLITAEKALLIEADGGKAATVEAEPALQNYIASRATSGAEIDYIHGEEELFRLARSPGNTGVLFPPFKKDGFFKTIIENGPLPRKSFSMGDADEKRFYLECRKLF
jgi:hypothetical protein